MSLESEVHKANEAKQILESPMFVAARAHLDAQLAQLRRAVPLRDTDMHTRLILMEQLSSNFYSYFEELALTGRLAEIQLRQEEEKRSALQRGVAWFRANGRQ